MFSLLYYAGILAYPFSFVNTFFDYFSREFIGDATKITTYSERNLWTIGENFITINTAEPPDLKINV